MKRRWQKYLLMIVFSGILSELFAAGTPAGTVIQSRSRVTYSSRSGSQIDTAYSAYVTIIVAQKGSFNIIPPANVLTTTKDSTNADYPVLVVNSGNGSDRGKLSSVSSKGWTTKIYFDANSDGILQAGEITAGTISQTAPLISDAQYRVIVRVAVPRGELLNGVKDTTVLILKSNFDSSKITTGSYVTTVRTSGIDPMNPGVTVDNPNPGAGQNVTFTFSFTNNGSVPAIGVTISDLIAGGFTFISATTNAGSFNSSSNPITWNIGTVSPGVTITVSVTVQVNANVSINTILGDQFVVKYSVDGNIYTLGSNTATVTVGGVTAYGVDVTAMFNTSSKEPLDTAWYRYNIRNSGSFKDVIELSSSSSLALSWKLFKDGNNNGSWDLNDPMLTNTNGKAGVDVDSVAIGDSVRVFAMASIPRVKTDQIRDSLQLTATSSGDGTKSDNEWTVTTMNVENVTIQKSVLPIGGQPAGTEMTYSIAYSNSGSAAVNNFSIVDTSPAETNYIANSVKVNGVSIPDNSGSVNISKDANNNTVIAVNVGTLATNTNGSIEFKLKIK
jgi:uncharacterized repeat protein (TIGR01451 family)